MMFQNPFFYIFCLLYFIIYQVHAIKTLPFLFHHFWHNINPAFRKKITWLQFFMNVDVPFIIFIFQHPIINSIISIVLFNLGFESKYPKSSINQLSVRDFIVSDNPLQHQFSLDFNWSLIHGMRFSEAFL